MSHAHIMSHLTHEIPCDISNFIVLEGGRLKLLLLVKSGHDLRAQMGSLELASPIKSCHSFICGFVDNTAFSKMKILHFVCTGTAMYVC